MRKICLLSVFVLSLLSYVKAQNWARDMHDPRVNFFTVQNEFNAWWDLYWHEILSDTSKGGGEKGEAWKLYKRWEQNMMPRMVATNGVRLGAEDAGEKNFYKNRPEQTSRSGANWAYIGAPMSFDDGGDSSTGRVNCVRFDPVNHNTIYCGAPTGGLWKSTDFGQSWHLLNTDNLPQIGVSDIVINPQNPNTIFIATGDIANEACLSVGVFKSIDGGQTWDTTGLTWTVSQGMLIARLLMSPLDSNTMFAATNTGVFKTVNGGATWAHVDTVYGLTGMEFNPANPNTIYTWGTQLYKSVNAGANWKKLSVGLPDSLISGGFGVGLTPADTSCVYVLASGDTVIPTESYFPFNGLYRSLDGGDTFHLQSTDIDPQGTQGTYDMNVAVSKVNRDLVIEGAVNSGFSADGGVTWTLAGVPSHVDHHDIRFFNGDTVFSADDGGLFVSYDAGNTWQGLNNGMHIGQLYNISSGGHSKYLYLSGRQDEGTLLQDTSWQKIVSTGDGMECYIDPLNENHWFGSIEEGFIGTSNNDGASITVLAYNLNASGINGPGAWNTPFVVQGDNAAVIYIAKDYIYKTSNNGENWTTLHSPALHGTDNLYQLLAVAPSDSNYIYAATNHSLYRSINGGSTFTNITDGLSGQFTSLAVSESNPQEIWVGFYGHTPELLKSVNAGSQFTNFGTGLPAAGPFYPISIAPVRDSKDALYASLANAGGVYYRDSTMASWMPYGSGLPNVSVDQLEVDYCAGKLRAATYGRDIWEIDPYQALNVPPVANAIYVSHAENCTDTIFFTDKSDFDPTSWQWYFPGGQPASSTAKNPVVTYPAGSSYAVTFIASNSNGVDTAKYNITTSLCTGISPVTENSAVDVYPNPGNGNFTVLLRGQSRGKVVLTLLNSVGQRVYQFSTSKDAEVITSEFSLSQLAKGIYYLEVAGEEGKVIQKLVIN